MAVADRTTAIDDALGVLPDTGRLHHMEFERDYASAPPSRNVVAAWLSAGYMWVIFEVDSEIDVRVAHIRAVLA